MKLNQFYVDNLIKEAISEDINYIDVSADYLIPEEQRNDSYFVAKADGVLCGDLGIVKGLAQLVIHGAILFDLIHQNAHLGLQRGVLLIERRIIVEDGVQELVDLFHVIAAEHGFFKLLILNFLRSQHEITPLFLT